MKLICSFHSGSVVLVSTEVSPCEGEGVKATQSQLWPEQGMPQGLSGNGIFSCPACRRCQRPEVAASHPSNCSLCFITRGCPKTLAMPCTARTTLEASGQHHQTQRCRRVPWKRHRVPRD